VAPLLLSLTTADFTRAGCPCRTTPAKASRISLFCGTTVSCWFKSICRLARLPFSRIQERVGCHVVQCLLDRGLAGVQVH